MKKLIATMTLMVLLCAGVSHAAQITCTYSGSGSGLLGGTAFSNAAFTITTVGDTGDRQSPFAGTFSITNQSASIAIQNLGSFSFVTGTYSFVNQEFGVGFGGIGQDTLDLFNITDIQQTSTWEMTTSIGPISTGMGHLDQWADVDVLTSGGALVFNDSSDIACVFTAEVVPEPSSLAVLAGGLALVPLRRRRLS